MPEYHIKVVGFDQRVCVKIKGYHSRKKYEYFALYTNYNEMKIFLYVSWQVKVMTSIRKPKRITIRGNDEREYHYLVKGGEDLRQDQRIEQLFFLMNQALESDPACKQRDLRIKTYQVIPMTSRFVWLLKPCFYDTLQSELSGSLKIHVLVSKHWASTLGVFDLTDGIQ